MDRLHDSCPICARKAAARFGVEMPNTRNAVVRGSAHCAATAALQPTTWWIVEAVRIMAGPEMENPGWVAGVGSYAMVVKPPPKVRECHSRSRMSFHAMRPAFKNERGAIVLDPIEDAPPR